MTTSFHLNEVGLSETNLPTSFWRLEPDSRYWGQRPLSNLIRGNQIVSDNLHRPYKEFVDLPQQISVNLESWRNLLYADRTDPRIKTQDLHIRMQLGPGEKLPSANVLNMRRTRLRNALNVPCFSRPKETPAMIECLKHEQYSLRSVRRCTSQPVHPWGIVPLSSPSAVIGPGPHIPPAPLPANYFTRRVDPRDPSRWIDSPHVESAVLKNKFACIAKLQDKAFEQSCCHWIFLENVDKPEAWVKKAIGQRHLRTGGHDITVPELQDIPDLALRWIKECVREATRKGEPVPILATLPAHARGWVGDCIRQGVELARLDAVANDRKEAEDRAREAAEETERQAWGEDPTTDDKNVQDALEASVNESEEHHEELALPTNQRRYRSTFVDSAEPYQASGEEIKNTVQENLGAYRPLPSVGIPLSSTASGKRKRSDEDFDIVCMQRYEMSVPMLTRK